MENQEQSLPHYRKITIVKKDNTRHVLTGPKYRLSFFTIKSTEHNHEVKLTVMYDNGPSEVKNWFFHSSEVIRVILYPKIDYF
jgi:hypothetical protein